MICDRNSNTACSFERIFDNTRAYSCSSSVLSLSGDLI